MAISSDKELSIQITLGGFSFQIVSQNSVISDGSAQSYDLDAMLGGYYSYPSVVGWSLPSVLVVASEVFDVAYVEGYLSAAGIFDPTTQKAMSAVRGAYAAVWAVDKELYHYVMSRMESAQHTHPLLDMIDRGTLLQNTIMVDIDAANTLFIAVWDENSLVVAESVGVVEPQDVLFFARRFSPQDFDMSYRLILMGEEQSEVAQLLGLYYRDLQIMERR